MLKMKFVAVSDVHIKIEGDKAERLFHQFLQHPLTTQANAIFLLGDIFDLIVGGHKEYLQAYPKTFDLLKKHLKEGKRIYQFEGNHDFHFEALLKYLKKEWELPDDSWTYHTNPMELTIDEKKFLFAHGDEIEIENPTYQRYRKFIRSGVINFLANKVVPFKIVNGIGVRASKKSRERNKKRYEVQEINPVVQDKFRRVFDIEREARNLDFLVCGHSHCKDLYEKEGWYSNNGYFPQTQTFTSYDSGKINHIKLGEL
ncbi:MAG: UDP-2,3-diacylglucosamine diphosphatase [Halobacteriovoraceae bacterium]|nr:UDP-2,3-diacylglucosamine diphosphatase [Halobacteriovoraceae bacterium]